MRSTSNKIVKGLFVLILLISIGCNKQSADPYDLVISNVTVIDGSGNPPKHKMYIGIKDGKNR